MAFSQRGSERGAISANNALIYRVGPAPGGNVFDDWRELVSYAQRINTFKTIYFDDTAVTNIIIPAGVWDLGMCEWAGIRDDGHAASVTIADGATFVTVPKRYRSVAVRNQNVSASPFSFTDVQQTSVHIEDTDGLFYGDFASDPGAAAIFLIAAGVPVQVVLRRAHIASFGNPSIMLQSGSGLETVLDSFSVIDAGSVDGPSDASFHVTNSQDSGVDPSQPLAPVQDSGFGSLSMGAYSALTLAALSGAQTIPPGFGSASLASPTTVGIINANVRSISLLRAQHQGNASNAGGQGVTYELHINGSPTTPAMSVVVPAGAGSHKNDFALPPNLPIVLQPGDVAQIVATPTAPLTAPVTDIMCTIDTSYV